MPRYNMSDLQRFFTRVDATHVRDPKHPHFGPLLWTGRVQIFPERDEMTVDKYGNPRAPYRNYPCFYADKSMVNAQRWLFFQMYDDRHLFNGRVTDIPQEHLDRIATHKADFQVVRDDAGKIDDYASENFHEQAWLCRDSKYMKLVFRVLDPEYKRDGITEPTMVKQWPEPMYMIYNDPNFVKTSETKFILSNFCKSNPLFLSEAEPVIHVTHTKWTQGSKSRGGRRSADDRSPVTKTGKRAETHTVTKMFPEHPLIFPEIVGPDRIILIQHYINGGTDADRPFQDLSERNFTVSAAYRALWPDRAAESDELHLR